MHSHYQIDPLLFQVSQQWNGAQKVDSVSNLVLITLKEFGVPFPPSLVLFWDAASRTSTHHPNGT